MVILFRIVEGESDTELSSCEVEDDQTVEQESESSEEDMSPSEEPGQGQSDDIHCPLWIRCNL